MSHNTRSKSPLGQTTRDNNRAVGNSKTSDLTKQRRNQVSTLQSTQRRADDPVPLVRRSTKTTSSRNAAKLPVVTESDEETADILVSTSVVALLEEALRKHSPGPRRTNPKPAAPPNENIIYETSNFLPESNCRNSLLNLNNLCVSDAVQIPSVRVTEDEEYEAFDGSKLTPRNVDVQPIRNVLAPVFIQAPTSSIDSATRPLISPSDIGDEADLSLGRTSPVKRKPVPVCTLSEISRQRLLSKYLATKPYTPSLLSFTEYTTPAQRLRVHPDRFLRSPYAPPDSDTLRKTSFERSRLVRAGFTFSTRLKRESVAGEYAVNPHAFPRAGSLHHLRSMETNTWAEDWSLRYVNLGFIQKTLFAFDLRMRTGHDLWVEDEQEVLASFGRRHEWETDWEVRWRVATWLMQ